MKNIFFSLKQIKNPKQIWIKPSLKKRNDKSAWVTIFSEFLLTEKFRPYFWMNATSYIYFYTLITYTFYITSVHIIQHALITTSNTDFYNSLQYTFFFLLKYYLAVPWPTSVQLSRIINPMLISSLTNPPMLITAFELFQPKDHWKSCSKVGSLSLATHLVGFEPGTFQF